MKCRIQVENIKCGGCATSITKGVQEIEGVSDVAVSVEEGQVEFTIAEAATEQAVKEKLLKMGYPEVGSVEGLQAAGAKAKSFVSCAVGKMSQD